MTRTRIALIAAAVMFLFLVAVRACGGSSEAPKASTPTPAPVATTAPTSPPSGDDEVGDEPIVVPSGAAPQAPAQRRPVRRPAPAKRVTELPGGIEAVADRVSWPDARRVAEISVRAGRILATLYARDATATVRTLRPLMSNSALEEVRARMAIDPAPVGTPVARARIIAINLGNDPETGSRIAQIFFDDPDEPNGGLGTVTLEFAPATAEIIQWAATPAE